MPLSSFCGLLTLQVGVAVLAAVFFTLAGVIIAANLFDYHNTTGLWPISLILVIIFVIGLILAGLFMFASSYNESRKFALIAMVIVIILLCYWIILCCFSFVSSPKHVRAVCVFIRCPESFWIAGLGYRNQHYVPPDYDEPTTSEPRTQKTTSPPTNETARVQRRYKRRLKNGTDDSLMHPTKPEITYQNENKLKKDNNNNSNQVKHNEFQNSIEKKTNLENTIGKYHYLQEKDDYGDTVPPRKTNDDDEDSRYVFGLPFLGAILLFIINLVFLLFTIFVLWSWASELDWADYYIEDEPVVIYEEGTNY